MCVYCENHTKKTSELKLGDIFIVAPAKYTEYGDGAPHKIPMYFCPACGEELNDRSNREQMHCTEHYTCLL